MVEPREPDPALASGCRNDPNSRGRRLSVLLLVAIAVTLVASCSNDENVLPYGPSDLDLRLSLQAVPDSLPRDGASQSTIVVETVSADGRPARLVVLRVELLSGGAPSELGSLSPRSLVTGDDGKARITYTAPPRPATTAAGSDVVVTIRVTASGGGLRPDLSRDVDLRLLLLAAGVADKPVPAFVTMPAMVVAGSPVTFDASATTDEGVRCGTACGFVWTLGDATTATGAIVTHVYTAPGSYAVTLTVTNPGGASGTLSRPIAVQPATRPTADFTFAPTRPSVREDIVFDAQRSTATAGRQIVSYVWDFGSGLSGRTGREIVKSYDVPATYPVTLTVTDSAGETGVVQKAVSVLPLP